MKNFIKTLLVVMALVLVVSAFAACERECVHAGGVATCTEAAVCELCGESYGEALGHSILADEAVAPTCTETGLKAGEHCTRCDYKVAQETVKALGHNMVENTDARVEPTYTAAGSETLVCSRGCGETVTNELPMLVAEMPEIEVLPVENPDLSVALNFAIKDVEELVKDEAYIEALFAKYGTCLVDYALTIEGLTSENVVFNANGTGDGYLGGQYDAYGESWVYVPFENVSIENGASFYIMQYASELLNQPGLRYTFAEVAEVVGNFDCGIYFTPEFLAANPNMVVKLELHVFTEDEAGVKTLVEGGIIANETFVVVDGVLTAQAD